MLSRSPRAHLHLALVVALAAALVIALAVPITGTKASTEGAARAPVAATGQGVVSALRYQAATVAAMMASPTSEPHGDLAMDYVSQLRSVAGGEVIPASLLAAAGQLVAGATLTSPETQASLIVQRRQAITFTVHEEGMAVRRVSSQMTVGRALAGLGVNITSHDAVKPSPETLLHPGMHVYVTYANNLRFIVNGDERIAYTRAETVGDFLAEAGVQMEPTDRIFPKLTDPIRSGMAVRLVSVRDNVEFTEDPIAYGTVYTYDADYDEGDEILVQAGSNGYARREYRIRRINGEEVSRELVTEIVVPPTDEIIALGTRVPPTPAPRKAPPPVVVTIEGLNCARTINVWATWYTAASAGGNGRTATGTGVYRGIVAVDPSVIPLGTRMFIPGYGYGLAADTGGGIRGHMIDLGFGADDVVDWRTRTVDICILS